MTFFRQFVLHDKTLIRPRTEEIYKINLNYLDECLILNREIQKGELAANTLITKQVYKHIRIVNKTVKPARVTNLNLQSEPLTTFKILIYPKIDHSRFEKLNDLLNMDNTDANSKKEI